MAKPIVLENPGENWRGDNWGGIIGDTHNYCGEENRGRKIEDTHNNCCAFPVFSYANEKEIDGCPHLAVFLNQESQGSVNAAADGDAGSHATAIVAAAVIAEADTAIHRRILAGRKSGADHQNQRYAKYYENSVSHLKRSLIQRPGL